MARTEKKAADKAPAKKAPPAPVMMKFGVKDLADLLDTDETYTRVKLRNASIEKKANGGRAYGWNTKEELKAVADQLKAEKPKAEKAAKPSKEKAEKPAKAAKAEKPAAKKADAKPAKDKAPAKKEASKKKAA